MNYPRMLTAFLLICATAGCAAQAANGQRHVAAHSSTSSGGTRCTMADSVLKNLQAGQMDAVAAALQDTLQMVTQACSEHPERAETGSSK
jgi:hypothetical protein